MDQASTNKIKEEFLAEICGSVNMLFGNLFQITPKMLSSHGLPGCPSADVAGQILLKKENWEGTLELRFPQKTIASLLEGYYKQPFPDLNSTAQSSVGELTNVLYCIIRKRMNEKGYGLSPELPRIILGATEHGIGESADHQSANIDFSTAYGNFTVHMSFRKPTQTNAQSA